MNIEYTEIDYPEDKDQENGNYNHICINCKTNFIGNKHRILCKKCKNKCLSV